MIVVQQQLVPAWDAVNGLGATLDIECGRRIGIVNAASLQTRNSCTMDQCECVKLQH